MDRKELGNRLQRPQHMNDFNRRRILRRILYYVEEVVRGSLLSSDHRRSRDSARYCVLCDENTREREL